MNINIPKEEVTPSALLTRYDLVKRAFGAYNNSQKAIDEMSKKISPYFLKCYEQEAKERTEEFINNFPNDGEFEDFKKQLVDNSIYGMLYEEEAKVLFNISKMFSGDIIEIGTFTGYSTSFLAKNSKVYTIDPWYQRVIIDFDVGFIHYFHENIKYEIAGKTRIEICESNWKSIGIRNNIIQIEKESDKAFNDVPDLVNSIFIDGNHEYNFVSNDIKNYKDKVMQNGYLLFHDVSYVGDMPHVPLAIYEFMIEDGDNWEGPYFVKTLMWFRRK